MQVRKARILLFVIGLAAVIYAGLKSYMEREEVIPSMGVLVASIPGALEAERVDAPFRHYIIRGASKKPLGVAYITTDLPPEIRGYIGPIHALVAINKEGIVKSVQIVKHEETPYYFNKLLGSGFIRRLFDIDLKKGGLDGVDTVSGATVSSQAILDDIDAASRLAAKKLFNVSIPEPERKKVELLKLGLLWLAFGIGIVARLKRRVKWLRWVSLASGLLIVGYYLNTPLSMAHLAEVLKGHIPPMTNPIALSLIAFTLITTPILGPMYCGYICPFAGLEELFYRLVPHKWRTSGKAIRRSLFFRDVFLFCVIIAVFLLGIKEASQIEPYPYLFSGSLSKLMWLYIIFVLLISAFIKRFWCRYFCPTGACLVLISKHARLGRIDSGIDA